MRIKVFMIVGIVVLLDIRCSSVSVTIGGQSPDEYFSGEATIATNAERIQKQWQLIQIGSEVSPYGILLADQNFKLHFDGSRYAAVAAAISFWGNYSMDEEEHIGFTYMGDNRIGIGGNMGMIVDRYINAIKKAKLYRLSTMQLTIESDDELLIFERRN